MTAAEFPAFYREIHGREPFPWQTRLAAEWCAGRWPSGVHVPTGCGKTSALDAFTFALACCEVREFPRRLFYVIDRRVVVDDILAHARQLARTICEALDQPLLKTTVAAVAQRLASLSHGGVPLVACGMRGGTRLEVDWAIAPDQPALIVSTIDQTGSRLLFRGYGASPAAWPIHAGLVGCDSALILDEAHLSKPFADTLAWLPRSACASQPVAAPPRFLELTATPHIAAASTLTLDATDLALPEIQRRTCAPKLATLHSAPGAEFTTRAANLAAGFLAQPDIRLVGVIVNRVALARGIFELLCRRGDADVFLLTGRIRPLDRDRLLRDLLPRCHATRDRSAVVPPTIVVATQTIEVGADLDFDALVTQSAPLPALRQRFGRLNRLGLHPSAEAVILHFEPEKTARNDDGKNDPVYGPDLAAHWDWLVKAEKSLPKPKRAKRNETTPPPPRLDFASASWPAFAASLGGEPPVTPRRAPVFLPAHARLLAHTSPTPEPDVDVQPWLHGVEAGPADVFVCWRADLTDANRDDWPDLVSALPPRRAELLPLSFATFRRWLSRHDLDPRATDAEGAADSTREREPLDQPVLRWDVEAPAVVAAQRIRPGDTVVLPASLGGTDEYGFNPDARPATDVAEAALAEALKGRRSAEFTLRLHPALMPAGMDDLLARFEAGEEITAAELAPLLAASLAPQATPALATVLRDFQERQPALDLTAYPEARPEGLLVTFITRALAGMTADADAEEAGGFRAPREPVTLPDHSARVVERTRVFADKLGLPAPLVRALELAAAGHDLGKLARHIQLMLRGGAPELAPGVPLAKSVRGAERVRSAFPGWRHEALSAALLRSALELPPDVDWELVCHLAGASHGRGRPFFLPAGQPPAELVHATLTGLAPGEIHAAGNPAEGAADCVGQASRLSPDSQPNVVRDRRDACPTAGLILSAPARHGLEALDSGWAEQWHRLLDRYGLWGLAWLEAILRLADQQVSAEESA